METNLMQGNFESDFMRLEGQVDALIRVCTQLKTENALLRGLQTQLVTERARLIEKNEMTRVRVESMITRLRMLDGET